MSSTEGGISISNSKNKKKPQVDCALLEYTKEDAITTYMKHSLSVTHQLPYDKGKFVTQNGN